MLAVGTTVTAFAAEEDQTEPVATQEPTTTTEPVAEKTIMPGDVNGDGVINVRDASLIQLYAAELIDNFVEDAPQELTLSETEVTLGVGESLALTTSYTEEDGAVVFSSDNEALVAVSIDGVLTARAEGEAVIKATAGFGMEAQCRVTVGKAISDIRLSATAKTLGVGEQFRLTATIPENEISYRQGFASADESVAVIDENGLVTAIAPGETTLSYQAYNGKFASFALTIKAAAESVSLNKTSLFLKPGEQFDLDSSVPEGQAAASRVFTSSDGRWIKAQHVHNYGWIYNKALGAGKNYSSINLNTLPAVADDLIFDLNLNQRAIYNYVYNISYRNSSSDTTENLCVEAFKYGRGSCYHHAAMIDYLYNRCGWETITVYGIDDYTGGSDQIRSDHERKDDGGSYHPADHCPADNGGSDNKADAKAGSHYQSARKTEQPVKRGAEAE